jgi:NAD(P)H-dependent FMN reductase
MKVAIVSGSNRPKAQSAKIARVVRHKLLTTGHEAVIIDLHRTPLPLFAAEATPEWADISAKIADADGFVWITPEWDGMAPPAMMNFIAHADRELAHKPVLLIAVSSGVGGAYPITELKAFGGKSRHHVLVPEQLIFREVEHVFNDTRPDPNNHRDVGMHERTDHALKTLLSFSKHLGAARQDLGEALTLYPRGM